MSRNEPGIAGEALAGEGARSAVLLAGSRAWRRESLVFLVYYVVYVAYLFVWPETESLHWVSLVVLPFLIVVFLGSRSGSASLRDALASVGLRRGNLRKGLVLAAVVGIALGTLALWAQEGFGAVRAMAASGKLFWFLPFAIVLMLVTAASTEEFFFRGVLQTRLTRWWGRSLPAVFATAILFGLYHVPYAYLEAGWSSHGHFAAAVSSGLTEGGIFGLIYGFIYARSRGNLLASILTHALFNAISGLVWLHVWGL